MTRPVYLGLLALLCAALVGCGGSANGQGGGGESDSEREEAFLALHRVDLLLPDCSRSFRRASEQLVPEMVTIALDSARQQRELWAGCFTGSPLRTLKWQPKIDFGDVPEEIAVNPGMVERFNQARALGLRTKLLRIVRRTPREVAGSGQLEALEMASETQGVGRVFLFTDALIVQPEGIRLRTATAAGVQRTIDRWAPRLAGLQQVELRLIGVGYGARDTHSVRMAKLLFGGLAAAVGVSSYSWSRELPADFPDD